jgi:hypothetical protein
MRIQKTQNFTLISYTFKELEKMLMEIVIWQNLSILVIEKSANSKFLHFFGLKLFN